MKHLNFLSKSGSRSCGHGSVTLASTVGSPSAHRRGTMLKLISVLVLILTIGVGQMWGADLDISLNCTTNIFNLRTTSGTDASSSELSKTYGVYTYKLKAGTNCYFSTNKIIFGQSGAYITFPAISGKKLTKVSITSTNSTGGAKVLICPTSSTTATTGGSEQTFTASTAATKNWTLTATADNTSYRMYINNAKNLHFNAIALEYTNVSTCTNPATALSVSSSASATAGTPMTLTTANGNGGPVTWEITNGSDKATLDGATLTPTKEGTVTVKATQDDYTTGGKTYCGGNASKTITITKAPATITLSELGATSSVSGTHYGGDSYTLPTSTDATCTGKKLVGWSTVEIEETDDKPTSNFYAKGEEVTLTAGLNTFYAVFAKVEGGTITIDPSSTSKTSTGYANTTWSAESTDGDTYTGSIRIWTSNTYAYLQVKNSETPTFYNDDAFSGPITQIKMVKNSGGTDRSWTPRLSATTKQTAANTSDGTNLTAKTVSTSGTTWDIDASNDYRYVYLGVASGATYLNSIEITYGTCSKYATSCCSSLGQINGSFFWTSCF